MKATITAVGFISLLMVATGVAAKHSESTRTRDIIAFETMYPVDGPFLGEANAIRGVIGDELPWRIDHRARGKLRTDGRLVIHVRGLVFTDDAEVPVEIQGTNDEPEFRGRVSCLTEEGSNVVTKNVTTAGFPATPSGNADIDAKLELPQPCVAPIVFILAGSEDKWFAVTGFEAK